ncbi:MAG: hypothetical protein ACJAWD_000773, partial [Methylophilaceae bacterium]
GYIDDSDKPLAWGADFLIHSPSEIADLI